jgi:hypothetical protein
MSIRYPLDACRAAHLPAGGLAALAPLRAKGGIRVIAGEPAWVEWDGDRPDIVAALLAVPGASLFVPRDGRWFAYGSHLPAFAVPPIGPATPLHQAVVPAPISPVDYPTAERGRVPLKLALCERPRPTSALRCSIASLQAWADAAPTSEIAAVMGARCGDIAWLMGTTLPAIADSERFWGERVLIPLGWRAEPDWPEAALREAAAVGSEEILVLTCDFAEAISRDAFRPLTRSAIRRAAHAFR